jgi:hypothetical protein
MLIGLACSISITSITYPNCSGCNYDSIACVFFLRRQSEISGQIKNRTEISRNINEIGWVTSGMRDPPDIISPDLKFCSAIGVSTRPMTKGA